jgi:fructose-specific phosphotransferase system IIC component
LEAGYLMGQSTRWQWKIIKVPEVFTMIKAVYMNRIIPLFGEFGRWYSD